VALHTRTRSTHSLPHISTVCVLDAEQFGVVQTLSDSEHNATRSTHDQQAVAHIQQTDRRALGTRYVVRTTIGPNMDGCKPRK